MRVERAFQEGRGLRGCLLRQVLRDHTAAGVAEAFERLPLERDLRLLRSVVYAGVWQKYYALENDKEKRRG